MKFYVLKILVVTIYKYWGFNTLDDVGGRGGGGGEVVMHPTVLRLVNENGDAWELVWATRGHHVNVN